MFAHVHPNDEHLERHLFLHTKSIHTPMKIKNTNTRRDFTAMFFSLTMAALALLLCPTTTSAQNATWNIKGKVLDETTMQPVGIEMDMVIIPAKTPTRKIIVKVNSATGDYLQPLPSGDSYSIRFSSYGVYFKEEIMELPPAAKYKEERRDFKVRRIIQGQLLAEAAAFDPMQTSLAATAATDLQPVIELMKKNVELQVVVSLAQETVPPPAPVKAPKPAKKAKGKKVEVAPDPVPVAAPAMNNEQLYTDRVAALKSFFAQAKDAEIRVTYEKGASAVGTPGAKNVRVAVGVVKSLLEE
jgi:hypothetical protein